MPANTPFAVVPQGPRFTPLRYGLLSAAQIVDDPDPHSLIGTKFTPDACEAANAVTAFCLAGGAATGTPEKIPTTDGAVVSAAEPFTVYAYTDCAPVGWGNDLEDMIARGTRHLDAGEGRAIERMFWTGVPDGGPTIYPHLAADTQVLADSDGATTVELQQAATVVTGGFTPVDALSVLEGELAACYGGEGVIHVPAEAVAYLSEKGVVTAQGPQLRTQLGNIVAAYSSGNREGPTGAAPAANSAWFYATGALMGRRGPVKGAGQRPSEFVGRNDNSTVFLVERTYTFDWDCCLFATEVVLRSAP